MNVLKPLKTIRKYVDEYLLNSFEEDKKTTEEIVTIIHELNSKVEKITSEPEDKTDEMLGEIRALINTLKENNIDTRKIEKYLDNSVNNNTSNNNVSNNNISTNDTSNNILSNDISDNSIITINNDIKSESEKQTEVLEDIKEGVKNTNDKLGEEEESSRLENIKNENNKNDSDNSDNDNNEGNLEDIKKAMLLQAESFDEIGENLADSMFSDNESDMELDPSDMMGDGSKNKRKKGRKSRRGKGLLGKVKSFLGKGKGVIKAGVGVASKMAVPLSVALSAFDYLSSDNTKERKESAGSGAGGVIGGVLGSFLGPLGTIAGAVAGNYLGGVVGDFFSNPQDEIPDDIKKAGPIEEIKYIDMVQIPEIMNNPNIDEDDKKEKIKDLTEYKISLETDEIPRFLKEKFNSKELKAYSKDEKFNILKDTISGINVDDYKIIEKEAEKILRIKSKKGMSGSVVNNNTDIYNNTDSNVTPDEISKKVEHYTKQGLKDPVKISIASGVPINEVKKRMEKERPVPSNNKYVNLGSIDKPVSLNSDESSYNTNDNNYNLEPQQMVSNNNVTNVYVKDDDHRFSNKSVEILRGM